MPHPYIEDSVIIIDKPYAWTSYNVVKKIQILLKHRFKGEKIKIGHAGTLDPLATGVLVLCIGKATKRIEQIQSMEKEYIADIYLGRTTPSFDLETPYNGEYPTEHITENDIKQALHNFIGIQQQIPPVYSAIQIDGHRAYKTAHKGGNIEMPPRQIEIYECQMLEYKIPVVKVRILCSKGTYIRSFANDLGKKLQSGAHLSGLIRTRIGPYSLENAETIEIFEKKLNSL